MSEINYKKELATIKKIAVTNGYSADMINSLLTKKRKKHAIGLSTSLLPADINNGRKWCKLPFFQKLSYKIGNLIPKDKYKVAFYTPHSLKKSLCKNKDTIEKTNLSGVYEVFCDCGASYVGQTGRDFTTRMKEHKKCKENGDETSMEAKHLLNSGHDCEFDPVILHVADKGRKLDALEQIEINRRKKSNKPLLNELLYYTSSPLLSIDFH
ncbi:uncharacterized protein LOC124158154 [Ischnura elegans]|uniref:uncharacterized protein LOC124158154 n=1 Tax=Ischnura elegans TaxID=197161 RepID=UPI001ED878EC|nr:uncharacterized protein LOC124158154 [Ischnura elegans]